MLNRTHFSLWPHAIPGLLTLSALLVLASPVFNLPVLAAIAGVVHLVCLWRARWIWRLAQKLVRFHTASDDCVVIHYAPELNGRIDLADSFERCRRTLDRLTKRFGFALRGRPHVYLFDTSQAVRGIFGARYNAIAFEPRSIALGYDDQFVEVLRHEFAHLYSGRLNPKAPAILCEGLSTWLQMTERGEPIDAAAWRFVSGPDFQLEKLLDRQHFFAEAHQYSCYLAAGSFTGFLVRRFGWKLYRKFYRKCDGTGFRTKFAKCFGLSLDVAKQEWLESVRNEGPMCHFHW